MAELRRKEQRRSYPTGSAVVLSRIHLSLAWAGIGQVGQGTGTAIEKTNPAALHNPRRRAGAPAIGEDQAAG